MNGKSEVLSSKSTNERESRSNLRVTLVNLRPHFYFALHWEKFTADGVLAQKLLKITAHYKEFLSFYVAFELKNFQNCDRGRSKH